MITLGSTSGYEAPEGLYNCRVKDFTIGDVIRKSRNDRHWSQTKLGEKAALFQIGTDPKPINKSTVSKVEREPYTSELLTVWRLLAALNLTFADVEKQIGMPFVKIVVVEKRRAAGKRG